MALTAVDTDEYRFLADSDLAVSFADGSRSDQPLTFVNAAFERLTGYPRDACIGRNCRFLQDEGTDRETVARIRDGIERRVFRLTVLKNYRLDGSAFENALLVGPLASDGEDWAETNRLFGMQWDLGATFARRMGASEGDWARRLLDRRVCNLETMVDRLVVSSRELGVTEVGPRLVGRLVAINRPQQYPIDGRLPNWTRADALMKYLLAPYYDVIGQSIDVDGDVGVLAADIAPVLALAVHELTRASLRLAEQSGQMMAVAVHFEDAMRDGEPTLCVRWQAIPSARPDPPAMSLARSSGSVDAGLIVLDGFVALAGGRLEVSHDDRSIDARLEVPNRAELRIVHAP